MFNLKSHKIIMTPLKDSQQEIFVARASLKVLETRKLFEQSQHKIYSEASAADWSKLSHASRMTPLIGR